MIRLISSVGQLLCKQQNLNHLKLQRHSSTVLCKNNVSYRSRFCEAGWKCFNKSVLKKHYGRDRKKSDTISTNNPLLQSGLLRQKNIASINWLKPWYRPIKGKILLQLTGAAAKDLYHHQILRSVHNINYFSYKTFARSYSKNKDKDLLTDLLTCSKVARKLKSKEGAVKKETVCKKEVGSAKPKDDKKLCTPNDGKKKAVCPPKAQQIKEKETVCKKEAGSAKPKDDKKLCTPHDGKKKAVCPPKAQQKIEKPSKPKEIVKKKEPCKPKETKKKEEPCKPKETKKKEEPCKPKEDKKKEPCKPKEDKKKEPCKPKEDPCKPKEDKKKDPCKPKENKEKEPCKPKEDPCKPKKDKKKEPCKPKEDPCKPKKDKKKEPCKPKEDPCKPKEDKKKDPCKPNECEKKESPCILGASKKKEDPCKPKENPCKPKENPCKAKEDPCKAKEDPCKPKEDPCKPKEDPCKAKEDPCKSKEDPCKAKEDPCKAKEDPCKPKEDPCKPKEDPCKPKEDPCKSKEDPCKPKEDPCKPEVSKKEESCKKEEIQCSGKGDNSSKEKCLDNPCNKTVKGDAKNKPPKPKPKRKPCIKCLQMSEADLSEDNTFKKLSESELLAQPTQISCAKSSLGSGTNICSRSISSDSANFNPERYTSRCQLSVGVKKRKWNMKIRPGGKCGAKRRCLKRTCTCKPSGSVDCTPRKSCKKCKRKSKPKSGGCIIK